MTIQAVYNVQASLAYALTMTEAAERKAVVLFTDIAGYVNFVSTKGSAAAMEWLHRHNALVRPVIEQFGGTFVKSTGDGLIAYFEQARPAVEAAVMIQQRLAAYNMGRREDEEIHIRVGLHMGEAVIEPGEIIGGAVNFAARLVAVCKRDQVLVSKDLYGKVKGLRHLSIRRIGRTSMQGIRGNPEVYEVCWDLTTLEETIKSALVPTEKSWQIRRFLLLGVLVIVAGFSLLLVWSHLARKSQGPEEQLSTKSAEAKQLYDQAGNYALKGDDEQALMALNQAIVADANFAEAYLEAAALYHEIGNNGKALQMARKAEQLSASLAEPFKLRLKGLLSELEGNPEVAVQTYQLLVDLYPNYADGHFYFADVAMSVGRLDEAERSLQSCLEIEPANPYCHYLLMMLQVRRNEFEAVLNSYESLRRKKIEYPWFDEPVGIAYWARDELNRATAHLQNLSQARAEGMRMHGSVHFVTSKEWIADIALYQGKLANAKRRLEQLLAGAEDVVLRASYLVYLAKIEALSGDRKAARSRAVEAIRTSTDAATLVNAARVLASVGAAKEATDALGQWRSSHGAKGEGHETSPVHFIRGALALSDGQFDKAIEELLLASERREDLEAQYLLAHAYMAAGQWDNAIKLLDRLIQSKGTILLDYLPSIWPLAHYDIAKCYERLGNEKEALANYSKFLELWSYADPGLREVIQAKEEVELLSKEKN